MLVSIREREYSRIWRKPSNSWNTNYRMSKSRNWELISKNQKLTNASITSSLSLYNLAITLLKIKTTKRISIIWIVSLNHSLFKIWRKMKVLADSVDRISSPVSAKKNQCSSRTCLSLIGMKLLVTKQPSPKLRVHQGVRRARNSSKLKSQVLKRSLPHH